MMGEYVAPSIKVIKDFIDYGDDLISLVLDLPDEAWKYSMVESHDNGSEGYESSIRNSREVGISYGIDRPKIFFDLSQRIYLAAKEYSKENGFNFSHMENVNLIEYDQSQGFFDRHADFGPRSPRSMSALLYLNDVGSGGETWFDKFNLNIVPEKGKLVLFPANYPYTHQAMPPLSGKKYVVVTWFGQDLDPSIFEEYFK